MAFRLHEGQTEMVLAGDGAGRCLGGAVRGVPVHHTADHGPGAGGTNAAGRFRAAPDTAARPAGVRYDRRAAFALVRTLRHDGVSGICVPERPAGHPPPFVRQPVHPGRGLLYAVPHGRPDDAPDGRSGHGAPHGVLDLVQRGGKHLPVSVFHDISVQRERRADAPSAGRCPGDPCMLVPVFTHSVSSVCVPAGKAVPHELGGAGKHRGQQNGARVRARGL